MADLTLGVDFGTTNTVLAVAGEDGAGKLVRFAAPRGELFAFRSALAFQAPPERPSERHVTAGPFAIEAYAADLRRPPAASARPRSLAAAIASRTCSPPSS